MATEFPTFVDTPEGEEPEPGTPDCDAVYLNSVGVAINTLENSLPGFVEASDLATVATTGAYTDLIGVPFIPAAPGDVGAQPAGSYQALDTDLTTFAGITPINDDVLQRKLGAWTNRTPAQLKTDLALAKTDVGLGNVDNTSDVSKPISAAVQAALDGIIGITDGLASDLEPLDTRISALEAVTGEYITAYGAVGDGLADSSTAFVAALAALPTSGGNIFLPPGDFLVTDAITVDRPLRVHGPGRIIGTGGSPSNVFELTADGSLILDGLTFSGCGRVVNLAFLVGTVPLLVARQCTFVNCLGVFVHYRSESSAASRLGMVRFQDNRVTASGSAEVGLLLQTDLIDRAIITGNEIRGVHKCGIFLGSEDTVGGDGANQQYEINYVITNNVLENISNLLTGAGDANAIKAYGRKIVIANNVIKNVSNALHADCEGIYTKAGWVSITGNVLEDAGQSEAAIDVKEQETVSGSTGFGLPSLVANNLINYTGAVDITTITQAGIRLAQRDCVVRGNIIRGANFKAIGTLTLQDMHHLVIEDNQIHEFHGNVAIDITAPGPGLKINRNRIWGMTEVDSGGTSLTGIRVIQTSSVYNTTVVNAASIGATSIVLNYQAPIGSTITIGAQTVTVTGAPNPYYGGRLGPYTVPITALGTAVSAAAAATIGIKAADIEISGNSLRTPVKPTATATAIALLVSGAHSMRHVRVTNNTIINWQRGVTFDTGTVGAIADVHVEENMLVNEDGTTPAVNLFTNPVTNLYMRNNIGYRTENQGAATIADGAASVEVAHGLARTPVGFTTTAGSVVAVGATFDATNVTFTRSGTSGALTVYWHGWAAAQGF